jgi:hypothetical protein
MEKNSELPNWNESEFLAFVLLYCAHVDMSYDDDEKRMIQSLLDKEHYIKVRDVYRSLNDAQCIQLIKDFKGLYYPTADRKDMLLEEIRKLFSADGKFESIEAGVLGTMEKVL